jgi:hypothetical protein
MKLYIALPTLHATTKKQSIMCIPTANPVIESGARVDTFLARAIPQIPVATATASTMTAP